MANQIKRSEIILANGTAAVISTSEVYPGEYETMLATPDFETEYRVLKSYDKETALSDHKWLKEQYHVPPLTGKYLQLSKDLAAAAIEGRAAAAGMIDGGTCNFDSPTLYLKGWSQKKVEQAARAAGLGCFVWNLWGTKYFVFSVNVSAQGDPRTTAAEAMSNYLKQKGYSAGMYYQMD